MINVEDKWPHIFHKADGVLNLNIVEKEMALNKNQNFISRNRKINNKLSWDK